MRRIVRSIPLASRARARALAVAFRKATAQRRIQHILDGGEVTAAHREETVRRDELLPTLAALGVDGRAAAARDHFVVASQQARQRIGHGAHNRQSHARDTLPLMRVYLGSDHAGYELKQHLIGWLSERGDEAVDCGPASYASGDDYPPFILRAAGSTAADQGSMGIVIGGSGNGEAIAANKVPGIRAALIWSEEIARLAREHNNANVASIGARMHGIEEATRLVEVFLTTPFSGDGRHERRVQMITEYEETRRLPPIA